MAFLTLKILAGMLQLHGPEAQISSDNQGVDYLLASVRDKLDDQSSRQAAGPKVAFYDKFVNPGPGYTKFYYKNGDWYTVGAKRALAPSSRGPTNPGHTTPGPTPGPTRGGRR